jgi:hypothetical protein
VPTELAFAPTSGRAGVLAGPGAEGWSMFGSDKPVNPLRKGTLFWGRSAPEAIYVYSLAVDDRGAFMLDRYAFRPAGERLQLALERRLSQGKVEQAEASLERKDR